MGLDRTVPYGSSATPSQKAQIFAETVPARPRQRPKERRGSSPPVRTPDRRPPAQSPWEARRAAGDMILPLESQRGKDRTGQGEEVRSEVFFEAGDSAGVPRPGVPRENPVVKRMHAVARVWQGLANSLGARFPARFAAYGVVNPVPPDGGALADGRAFARWLARIGDLTNHGRIEALAVDLNYRWKRGRFVRRSGFVFRMALLRAPLRMVLAMRFGGKRERWFTIPLGRK